MIPLRFLFQIIVAVLFLRTEAFQFRPSTLTPSKIKPTTTTTTTTTNNINHSTIKFQTHFHNKSPNWIHRFSNSRRTTDSAFIVTRFAEPETKSIQEEAKETTIGSNSSTALPRTPNQGDDGVIIGDHTADTTVNETVHESVPFFASASVNATNASAEKADKNSENDIVEQDRVGLVTRRDVFRYSAVLASAVWVTGLTFTQTDPSLKKPRQPTIPPLKPKISPQAVPTSKLEPVNLTEVVSQTNVNVTMNCPKMCVSIDSSNFTFNKVEKAKAPDWLPSFLAPKSQVVKKIPNSELLVAATVAGSVTEMLRTSLLYPLQTVKVRLQADLNEKIVDQKSLERPSLSKQITTLGSNIRQKVDEGNLYAGISPTLLVSVPATGIYYGVRDVTKRILFMTPLDSTWIAVGGALVGDVVSLCFRVPSDALAIRLQAQQNSTATMGDWLGDSFRRLPMVILTDLPYLLSKIVLNKSLIQGNMSVSEYAIFAVFASVIAGFLTTPFDVARTRILLDKWSDVPSEEEEEDVDKHIFGTQSLHLENGENLVSDSLESSDTISHETTTQLEDDTSDAKSNPTTNNPGNSVIRTMIQITKEGDGGIENLFSGWLERVVYLGIGRAWLEPIQLVGYIGIRDAVLLEWF